MAPAVVVTLDSTFIRSCENSERRLEVRVGNVETKSGEQVFGSVANAETDFKVPINRNLDAVRHSFRFVARPIMVLSARASDSDSSQPTILTRQWP
jgi:hypothetical protein